MSYSQAVRTALAGLEAAEPCCRGALLGGVIAVAGRGRDGGLVVEVENAAVARLAFRLAKERSAVAPRLLAGAHPYRVEIGDAAGLDGPLDGPRARALRRRCCRRSWLRGAFVGGGSLTRPERAYHLEFLAPETVAGAIVALLGREGIRAGQDERRIYVKAAEDIVAFLSVVGAVAERMAYEQVLVGRDLKNRVQRGVNCETANLSRTVEAAQRQVAVIEALRDSGELDALAVELRQTADLRVRHPYATLTDLAALHAPPLSKSAVNHRLRALLRASTRIRPSGG